MKVTDIAGFRTHVDEYLAAAAQGKEVEIRERNRPVARLVPVRVNGRNRTVLGCGAGTVVVKSDLAGPMIPHGDWEML